MKAHKSKHIIFNGYGTEVVDFIVFRVHKHMISENQLLYVSDLLDQSESSFPLATELYLELLEF